MKRRLACVALIIAVCLLMHLAGRADADGPEGPGYPCPSCKVDRGYDYVGSSDASAIGWGTVYWYNCRNCGSTFLWRTSPGGGMHVRGPLERLEHFRRW